MVSKAKESKEIQKFRKKLKKQISAQKKQLNQEALIHVKQVMTKWIARHSDERVEMRKRRIVVFDENQHPAEITSPFVHELLNEIKISAIASSKMFQAKKI